MNIEELENRLLEEGCKWFVIPPFQHDGVNVALATGVDVLENENGIWKIYFAERGTKKTPIFESSSEKEACDHYYKIITSEEHWHIVGVYENEINAFKLQEKLENIEVNFRKNSRLPSKDGDPGLIFISVLGKAIFKVRELYSDLPLKDYPANNLK